MKGKLFALLQTILPQHLLSRLVGKLAECRNPAVKNFLIKSAIRVYQVNMEEAEEPNPKAYDHFNAFFTRALKPGVRVFSQNSNVLTSPADGFMSQQGPISDGLIIQAKGKTYQLSDLLGGDQVESTKFMGGSFLTIYLSPKDYHRLHMPVAGTLKKMIHVPGRLFSVNDTTADNIPRLFARNERVVAIFDTDVGPMALILVGAIIVASIETVWHGLVTPPTRSTVQHWDYQDQSIYLEKGAEMGRFKMGSTIIVLFGKDAVRLNSIESGAVMRLGQDIGTKALS